MNHAEPREPIFPLMESSPVRLPMRAPRLGANFAAGHYDLTAETRIFPGAWSARWTRAMHALTGSVVRSHTSMG